MDSPEPARRCPRCKTSNRAERRFCRQCGAGLCVTCARCGCDNDHGDRFCGACGDALAASAAAVSSPARSSTTPVPDPGMATPTATAADNIAPPAHDDRPRQRALSSKLAALNRECVRDAAVSAPDFDDEQITEIGQADIDAMFTG